MTETIQDPRTVAIAAYRGAVRRYFAAVVALRATTTAIMAGDPDVGTAHLTHDANAVHGAQASMTRAAGVYLTAAAADGDPDGPHHLEAALVEARALAVDAAYRDEAGQVGLFGELK